MTIALVGKSPIDWARPDGCPAGFEPRQVVNGNGSGLAIEIVITKWTKGDLPNREALTRLHKIRVNERATPVVLVVELENGGALVFGPTDRTPS